MRMPSLPPSSVSRAALRFAARHGISLDTAHRDPGDALGFALLDPKRAPERGEWLRVVRYHAKVNAKRAPAMSTGRSNAATRFLAAYRVAPGEVLPRRAAELLMSEWDRAARRALRKPSDPIWRCEWWVDGRKRFRVALEFAQDGAAVVRYFGL